VCKSAAENGRALVPSRRHPTLTPRQPAMSVSSVDLLRSMEAGTSPSWRALLCDPCAASAVASGVLCAAQGFLELTGPAASPSPLKSAWSSPPRPSPELSPPCTPPPEMPRAKRAPLLMPTPSMDLALSVGDEQEDAVPQPPRTPPSRVGRPSRRAAAASSGHSDLDDFDPLSPEILPESFAEMYGGSHSLTPSSHAAVARVHDVLRSGSSVGYDSPPLDDTLNLRRSRSLSSAAAAPIAVVAFSPQEEAPHAGSDTESTLSDDATTTLRKNTRSKSRVQALASRDTDAFADMLRSRRRELLQSPPDQPVGRQRAKQLRLLGDCIAAAATRGLGVRLSGSSVVLLHPPGWTSLVHGIEGAAASSCECLSGTLQLLGAMLSVHPRHKRGPECVFSIGFEASVTAFRALSRLVPLLVHLPFALTRVITSHPVVGVYEQRHDSLDAAPPGSPLLERDLLDEESVHEISTAAPPHRDGRWAAFRRRLEELQHPDSVSGSGPEQVRPTKQSRGLIDKAEIDELRVLAASASSNAHFRPGAHDVVRVCSVRARALGIPAQSLAKQRAQFTDSLSRLSQEQALSCVGFDTASKQKTFALHVDEFVASTRGATATLGCVWAAREVVRCWLQQGVLPQVVRDVTMDREIGSDAMRLDRLESRLTVKTESRSDSPAARRRPCPPVSRLCPVSSGHGELHGLLRSVLRGIDLTFALVLAQLNDHFLTQEVLSVVTSVLGGEGVSDRLEDLAESVGLRRATTHMVTLRRLRTLGRVVGIIASLPAWVTAADREMESLPPPVGCSLPIDACGLLTSALKRGELCDVSTAVLSMVQVLVTSKATREAFRAELARLSATSSSIADEVRRSIATSVADDAEFMTVPRLVALDTLDSIVLQTGLPPALSILGALHPTRPLTDGAIRLVGWQGLLDVCPAFSQCKSALTVNDSRLLQLGFAPSSVPLVALATETVPAEMMVRRADSGGLRKRVTVTRVTGSGSLSTPSCLSLPSVRDELSAAFMVRYPTLMGVIDSSLPAMVLVAVQAVLPSTAREIIDPALDRDTLVKSVVNSVRVSITKGLEGDLHSVLSLVARSTLSLNDSQRDSIVKTAVRVVRPQVRDQIAKASFPLARSFVDQLLARASREAESSA
jgi:hypothetical protein